MWKNCNQILTKPAFLTARKCNIIRTAYGSSSSKTLGICREDGSTWERRAPLSPSHVKQLVRQGYNALVQPSNRRAFPMQEYAKVGATIKEDLTDASVIFGVKQVHVDALLPEKTYMFFSHTIKAQEANMALLDALIKKNVRLIDYEKLEDASGRRLVAFGKYAGVAGMINILHGLGLRLLALGHHTPYMHIGPAHNYRNSGMAQQVIRDAGYEITLGMMPKSIGPLVFIFTGAGNVSQGAQEIFQSLPHEYVSIENLPKVARHGATDKVYGCVVDMEDNLVRKDGGAFDFNDYVRQPDQYASTFSVKVAPYSSVIVNGIFYAPGAPRLITIPDAKKLLQPQTTPWIPISDGCPQLPHRLLAICDISADPGGSIEFMKECTTINKPFVLYDAEQNIDSESFAGDGVLMCSVDNMPAQIPRESTEFFGALLMPHLQDIMLSNATEPFSKCSLSDTVKNAIITSNGELTPKFKYIDDLRRKNRESRKVMLQHQESSKKVLIVGAGYVSAPVVDYLTRNPRVQVTVGAAIKDEIDRLTAKYSNTVPVLLDIHRSQDELDNLIQAHDLVISLLPYSLHPEIAQKCIHHKTNMVTASYKSQQMDDLHDRAVEAGVTIMNEVGVDPGIDHLLAMECFDEIKAHGGRVTSFVSFCGGLPAPEDSDNPLRYKFSWSPRGVLSNVLSSAQFLLNGKICQIPDNGALLDSTERIRYLPGFHLEGFPNRDSTVYRELYGIEEAHTIIRGTLRYKGFSEAMKALLKLGLIDVTEHPRLHPEGPNISWRELIAELSGAQPNILVHSLKDHLYQQLDKDVDSLRTVEELGLLDDELVDRRSTPLDTLSNYLAKRLAYGPGERDLIIMRHDVGVEWPDRSTETRHVDLVVYGDAKGYSAMAATVGFPTGIASQMVLDGEIQGTGMLLPFTKEIYRPMLKRLSKENIIARESVTPGNPAIENENVRY